VAQQKINSCDAKIKAQKEAAEAKRRAEIQSLATTYTINGVSFTMKYVEGGTFQMRASPNFSGHTMVVSDFCIGETEVTQELWEAVMDSNPSYFKGDNLPVENVSWNDCQEFIRKLNQLTGKNFRLPKEAEWEYAARGGKKSHGYKYSGSNTIGEVAWYKDNSGNKTHPVRTKSPNELGLYDMSGNVYEWCSEWYSNSWPMEQKPTNISSGTPRMMRGGSWDYHAEACQVFYISGWGHDYSTSKYGFRLALSK
jgi:formylglycine-generating enzyme required for sulfatase activity